MAEVAEQVEAELVAVITAVHDGEPLALTTEGGRRLPSGPLQTEHRSMQAGMRSWVTRQTGHDLGYVELCAGTDGTDCDNLIAPGEYTDINLTDVESIRLFSY